MNHGLTIVTIVTVYVIYLYANIQWMYGKYGKKIKQNMATVLHICTPVKMQELLYLIFF